MRSEVLFIAFIGLRPGFAAQNTSAAPIYPADVYSEFLPPGIVQPPTADLTHSMMLLQAGQRSAALGLTQASATQAWQNAQNSLNSSLPAAPETPGPRSPVIRGRIRTGTPHTLFRGRTASELNRLLATEGAINVEVVADSITIDQPIEITKSGLHLDLAAASVHASLAGYMLRIENANRVLIEGGNFIGGDSAILVNASTNVAIQDVRISNLTGAGIVVTASSAVRISDSEISATALAGVMLHRATFSSLVIHNALSGMAGFSNMMAGIVLTDREVDVTADPRAVLGPDGYWVISQPMMQRLHPPHDNLVAWNRIDRSATSGVYSDGGIRNVIYANTITASSKEGLCLDNGSAANVVASNDISGNGTRWGEPESALTLDSVISGGLLPDGTAAEKVPGISLDNAVWNEVFANRVAHNSGGGVKIVRSGYFNAIGLNTLVDNNDGASAGFHYFGVELGAAASDAPSSELDFTPSRGNIVFSNNIRGNHYSGIFLDAGSDQNNILFNTILDATNWALESVSPMMNYPLNNLTTLHSRNIGSGLDPALVSTGQPVNDSP